MPPHPRAGIIPKAGRAPATPRPEGMLVPHDRTQRRGPLRGALTLLASALLALLVANSPYGPLYRRLWRTPYHLGPWLVTTAQSVVDKGLMTLFFLLIGLELRREVAHGALRHMRAMLLPLWAAATGMLLPALIYHLINPHGEAARGWAIPMSTDVAFAAAALAVLGRRAPRSLLVLLLALAVADDIGAILVIALYYHHGLRPVPLAGALLAFAALFAAGRRGSRRPWLYGILGGLLWGALWRGGIDPPLAGVLLAVSLPAPGTTAPATGAPPASRLERRLAPYVTYGALPLFALAHAGLSLAGPGVGISGGVFLGVFLGLLLGKFCGVGGGAWLATTLRFGALPGGVTRRHLGAAAWLAGIGFTMALFIATLAFPPGPLRDAAKLAILTASPLAFLAAAAWMWAGDRQAPAVSAAGGESAPRAP